MAKRNATNIEMMARKFVDKNKIRYCQHWRGHFCKICKDRTNKARFVRLGSSLEAS